MKSSNFARDAKWEAKEIINAEGPGINQTPEHRELHAKQQETLPQSLGKKIQGK